MKEDNFELVKSVPADQLPDEALRSIAKGQLVVMAYQDDDGKIRFLANTGYIDAHLHKALAVSMIEVVSVAITLTRHCHFEGEDV